MRHEIEIWLSPEDSTIEDKILNACASELALHEEEINGFRIMRRSIDARKKPVKILLRIEVFIGEALPPLIQPVLLPEVHHRPEIHIVGAGPAGLFAALEAIELQFKPVVWERGKDVRSRRRDLAAINKEHRVNPESNYCFGEGGAGTYSDGKLYTRSTKRGDVKKVLSLLVQFGADENILYDAHPHIGTNKLPAIITAMREKVIACGGEVNFNSKLTDIFFENSAITGIQINGDRIVKTNSLILATGHSARDIFYLLHSHKILIEAKPFAIGVRAEHSQTLIDKIQYRQENRGEHLPPASYSLVSQVDGKGVFSFCMCPGGIIAPCATAPGEVVTNGWSPSKRNNPWSNSGIVVTVDQKDFEEQGFSGPLSGLQYQQMIEKVCWEKAGKTQAVPAQRIPDFVSGKLSKSLPSCSYQPGIVSCRIDTLLPSSIVDRLRKAFIDFGRKMPGYFSEDGIIVAPESRTSSPVRIPRDTGFQHPEIRGLFPCGEGAGYAGGIVSAAIDGQRCAAAAVTKLLHVES